METISRQKSILLIEASNIGGDGGAITHLKEFLAKGNFSQYYIKEVVVCCSDNTFYKINPSKSEVIHHQHRWLNGGYMRKLLWKIFVLKKLIKQLKPLLFIPGGGNPIWPYPFVTMFRNLLPVDKNERDRFKYTFTWFRYLLLNFYFSRSFIRADGLICLNEYCYDVLPKNVKDNLNSYTIIPHGLNDRFKTTPKNRYNFNAEIKILYVSRINLYKHQWKVAEAVLMLKQEGYNVKLQLIGSQEGHGRSKLNQVLNAYTESINTIELIEEVSQNSLVDYYKKADIFVFASTCETFGMILLEAMGMGLPIICSNRSSLSGLLKSNGLYFDPECTDSLIRQLKLMIRDQDLREKFGYGAHQDAVKYKWSESANQTLHFITDKLSIKNE